jgi:hypothetical protein
MSFNNTNINIDNNASQNIDNIAQSFFIVLIFCSLVSDSYLLFDNFIKNDYIKKKVNYCKKIYKITVDLFFNNYEKDNEGNIIINKKNIKTIKCKNIKNIKDTKDNIQLKSKNPFDEEYENDIIENDIQYNKKIEIDKEHNNKEYNDNENKEFNKIQNKEPEQIEDKEPEQIEDKEKLIIKKNIELINEIPENIKQEKIYIKKNKENYIKKIKKNIDNKITESNIDNYLIDKIDKIENNDNKNIKEIIKKKTKKK